MKCKYVYPSSTKPCNYANVRRGQLVQTNNKHNSVGCALLLLVTKALLLWHFIGDNFHRSKYWEGCFVQLWNNQPFDFWRYMLQYRTTDWIPNVPNSHHELSRSLKSAYSFQHTKFLNVILAMSHLCWQICFYCRYKYILDENKRQRIYTSHFIPKTVWSNMCTSQYIVRSSYALFARGSQNKLLILKRSPVRLYTAPPKLLDEYLDEIRS
jgi:hypothetical protein